MYAFHYIYAECESVTRGDETP